MRYRLLISLILLTAGPSWAATRYAAPTGSGSACTVQGTPCALQTAINQAVATDTVELANGTYTGQFTLNSAANGSAGSRITLRATNLHGAILESTSGCNDTVGLYVNKAYWTIERLHFRQQGRAIFVQTAGANNVIIQDNLLEDYAGNALSSYEGASDNLFQRNVVGYPKTSCLAAPENVGVYIYKSINNIVRDNIFVGTGDNGYQAGNKSGYGIQVASSIDAPTASTNNLIQGNLVLSAGGKAGTRFLSVSGNTLQDNQVYWSEGSGSDSGDCSDDSNSFLNNLLYGNYYANGGTKGDTLSGQRGNITWRHNTIYVDDFSRYGIRNVNGGFPPEEEPLCELGHKTNTTLKDNVFYAPGALSAAGTRILYGQDSQTQMLDGNYNTFYAPSGTTTLNYTLGANDLTSQPTFTNATNGELELATGSVGTPGNSPASDNTKRGITFNSFLKQGWAKRVFDLQTVTSQTLNQISYTFTNVNPNSYYHVWFYLPTSPCSSTNEQFTIEGAADSTLIRNIPAVNIDTWTQTGGPQRWLSLGHHKDTNSDSNLTISWGTATCVDKLFIRQLPTMTDAYQWILQPDPETQTLVGWWGMDDAYPSTTVIDASGNGRDGVFCEAGTCPGSLVDGETWVPGRISGGLHLDGTDDHVQVPYNTAFDITSDITIEAWVQRAAVDVRGTILAKTNRTSLWDYHLWLCDDGTYAPCIGHENAIAFSRSDGTTVFSTTAVTDLNYNHLTFVRQGTGYVFYINGVASGNGTLTGSFTASAVPLVFGNDATGGDYFSGDLDAVRLYNYALDGATVLSHVEVGNRPSQTAWRWRRIDEPETGKWLADQNQQASMVIGNKARLRVGALNTISETPLQNYSLYCRNPAGTGNWLRVGSSCATNPMCYAFDQVMTQFQNLSNQMSLPTYTYTDVGVFVEGTDSNMPVSAVDLNEYLELEFTLQMNSTITPGTVLGCCLRLGIGIELDNCVEATVKAVKGRAQLTP